MSEADELMDAFEAYARAPLDPEARQRAIDAVERFATAVQPVVGEELAARFDQAYAAFWVACDRERALLAQYVHSGPDDADEGFLRRLHADVEEAERVCEAVRAEVIQVIAERGE
jgi:hypothetical protein